MPAGPTSVAALYVHAPFCARRCVYCDFAVTVRKEGDLPAWLEALEAELTRVEDEGLFLVADSLETLYVGGGTPSLLGPSSMAGLANVVGPERLLRDGLEWTAEANPESFTDEVAEGWARAGVNRISLGLQTFHEGALRWMGRLHGVAGPPRALEAARRSGIENLSVDLIFGLPASVGRSWTDDLERVLALDVSHVSLYGLTVEPATPLGRAVAEGREPPVDEEQYRAEFLQAAETLSAAGYEQYEVSNFARPGHRARHNAIYWQGAPYLGLGNGAHSYAPPVRRWNVRDFETYRARLLAGRSAEEEREVVDRAGAALESVWLGLRTKDGLDLATLTSDGRRLVQEWQDRGLALCTTDRIRLTPEGWLLLDRLAVELDASSDPG